MCSSDHRRVNRDEIARAPHYVVARLLAVGVAYALLIVYANQRPDSPIGSALRWWMNESAPWVQTLLFFETTPSSENAEEIRASVLAYRHVLVGSICFALYSIVASRRYWLAWTCALSVKMERAGRSKAEFERLSEVGFHRMILGAIATTFLAIYVEPSEGPSSLWPASSNWAILRAPILIGVATAFVLLAATFRRTTACLRRSRMHP